MESVCKIPIAAGLPFFLDTAFENNGMHPARDTNVLIYNPGPQRAGDAGR